MHQVQEFDREHNLVVNVCVVLYIDDKVAVFTGFRAGEKQRARKREWQMPKKFVCDCWVCC